MATNNHNKMYINEDGKRVMRVTEVIKILAKDQLIVWANMLGFKHIDYKKELERTANIGTLFHDVIEQYTDPRKVAIVDYQANHVYGFQNQLEATHAIDSFIKWYGDNRDRFKVVFREKVVVGRELGGTIDTGIEGWEDRNKVILCDYKTSSDFYLTQFLQLAGYVKIYEEKYGKNTVEGIMVIRADKKSGNKAVGKFMDRAETEALITAFDCMFNTAIAINYLNRGWFNLGRTIK